MSEERRNRIRERAHQLWEQEGQPAGRDVDHWIAAEQHIDRESSPTPESQPNEGEGNRTAARGYNRKAKAFAETGPVDRQARAAKADREGPKGDELRAAEAAGLRHRHGEDPEVGSA
jgi:hypothetical protein